MMTVTIPMYFLVVTYTGIQLFLHMKEHILTDVTLFLLATVPHWYDVWLSDIQQNRVELFQLTAGDTNERSV